MPNAQYPHDSIQVQAANRRLDVAEILAQCDSQGISVLHGLNAQGFSFAHPDRSLALDLSALNAILDYTVEDQVVCVESGITLEALNRKLAENGQWLPVSAYPANLTLHDLLNSGNAGSLETQTGGLRDLVLGMEAALVDGTTVKTGGKVVKNVSGYDLSKLFVGSLGTLCVPLSVNLRIAARPDSDQVLTAQYRSLEELFVACRELAKSGISISCLDVISTPLMLAMLEDIAGHVHLAEFQAIADEGGKDNARRFTLIVQIQGVNKVVQETAKFLSQRSVLKGLPATDIEAFKEILTRLFDPSFASSTLLKKHSCEFSLSSSQAGELFAKVSWLKEIPFQYRPKTGRLKFFLKDEAMLEALEESVLIGGSSGASKGPSGGASYSMALINGEGKYRLSTLPLADDSSRHCLVELKKKLKASFDPKGILNPMFDIWS